MVKPEIVSLDSSQTTIEKEKLDVENAVVESAWCIACAACAAAACGPELAFLATGALTTSGE
ncbi:MAG: hypothetical protein LBG80_13935 [Bacteroidales bacterium]|nr:hypothetical protein [Bacteroidales bacterium]